MAMVSSSSNDNIHIAVGVDGSIEVEKRGGALRQSTAVKDEQQQVEDRVLSNNAAQGLIIHTHLGDIRIHFTPELAGESSIKYIKDVVQAASTKRNSGMGYNTAETENGRRITEGYMCQKCKLVCGYLSSLEDTYDMLF